MKEKTKHYIVYSLMLIGVIPLFFAVNQPASWDLNSKSFALYISAVLGYVGLWLLTWELILGTRSVSGLLFKDLPSKLSLHSKLGKYGVILIFLHPLLITYSYGENLLYSILPSLNGEFEKNVTFGRFALFGLLVIWVTSAIIRGKISYRPWKYIHYVSYPVMFAALIHVPEIGSSFGNQLIRVYWYALVSIILVCLALRMRHLFGFSKYPYEVVGHKQLSEKIWVIDLKPFDKNLHIKTGQYVYLQPDLLSEEHPFSVLNHSDADGTISLGYKVFGKFTEKLSLTNLGDKVLLDGPYGVFTNEINVKPEIPAVFIAGGIGVTPFVKHCMDSAGDRKMFYAVRSDKSPAFKNVLEPVLGKNLIMVVEKSDKPARANDERGFISKETIQKYVDLTKPNEFYICGPEKMMETAVEILKELGVRKNNIHVESFAY